MTKEKSRRTFLDRDFGSTYGKPESYNLQAPKKKKPGKPCARSSGKGLIFKGSTSQALDKIDRKLILRNAGAQ